MNVYTIHMAECSYHLQTQSRDSVGSVSFSSLPALGLNFEPP